MISWDASTDPSATMSSVCFLFCVQMLPEGVANALRAGKSAPASTHAEVTILFSDIVGFTNIAALCSPMEICRLLDSLCESRHV